MTTILSLVSAKGVTDPLPEQQAGAVAAGLREISGLSVYPPSIVAAGGSLFFLGRKDGEKRLGLLTARDASAAALAGEARGVAADGAALTLLTCETSTANAAALRSVLPFLAPQLLGLEKSIGCGDRLGLATPGHIRAVRRSSMAPILAQQSIRENARTGRTPQEVINDALWGVFQEGWRGGFGADADHLKTTADIDACAAAGYTFYTIDPGDHVDNGADAASAGDLRRKVDALPWADLETTFEDLRGRLGAEPVDLGDSAVKISDEELQRAAAKYGRVVAHTARMYRHLDRALSGRAFELEMSVDETETVTSIAEHIYIAHELRRLGVRWVSLAPRYVGRFEKGVDYIGDLDEFERSFAGHLAVSRAFGPYKLSLHSGSDKFSVYPVAARVAEDLVHLKTAGTSYLEALRAVASVNPALFREIAAFAADRYPEDRATYHVSAELEKMPSAGNLSDAELARLLDDFHAREVLHVTYGSVLNRPELRGAFFETLRSGEEIHYRMLEDHFARHLAPFGAQPRSAAGERVR